MSDTDVSVETLEFLKAGFPSLAKEFLDALAEIRTLHQRAIATASLLHAYGYEVPEEVDGFVIPRWWLK